MTLPKKQRRVDLGWLLYAKTGFKQVREKSRDGTRRLQMDISFTCHTVPDIAKCLFSQIVLQVKDLWPNMTLNFVVLITQKLN